MYPKKKRKIESLSNSPKDSPQLSAFAARRALQVGSQASPAQDGSSLSNGPQTTPNSAFSVFEKGALVPEYDSDEQTKINVGEDKATSGKLIVNVEEEGDESSSSSSESRVDSQEIAIDGPSISFSSFKPSKSNVKELKDGTLLIRLAPGERLVLVGQYGITIRKGQITLLGSTLKASKTLHKVYAPSSHALPIIRCLATDIDAAEICLHQRESGLGRLSTLSPLFGKLWNDGTGSLGSEFESLLGKRDGSTYQTLFSLQDEPQKAYLYPLISPPEWNAALAKLTEPSERARAVFVCGPKSSGKSTFTRLLTNRLLSERSSSTGALALLDLDPGQPEYSTPGHLSLVYLQEPNFGPPFAHPIPPGKRRTFRSHAVGAITPSMDPSLYMACATDLLSHYRNVLSVSPNCPLIINTSGWVQGTGLEILTDLITKVQPTDIIYMSQEGPLEVTTSLKEAAKGKPFFTLPSQASEFTTRTAAHLRTMQTMAYFHLSPSSNGESFNDIPLTSIPPWEIRYSGEDSGMLGIICYGEQPPASFLADTINGSLVSIVVIEDLAALRLNAEAAEHDFLPLATDSDLHLFDESPRPLQEPLLVRTPNEDLPYYNPLNTITLDPKHSHTIGLALVRGIDAERKRLQILCPIEPSVIEEINVQGKKIVLVSGKLDTPGWAYTEDLYRKVALEKERKKAGEDGDVEMSDGFEDAPWVETRDGSQGRGIGARVWRVRRDLGKMGDGD